MSREDLEAIARELAMTHTSTLLSTGRAILAALEKVDRQAREEAERKYAAEILALVPEYEKRVAAAVAAERERAAKIAEEYNCEDGHCCTCAPLAAIAIREGA